MAASQNPARVPRRAIERRGVDPSAMPVMNAAAIVANAYVVGPRIERDQPRPRDLVHESGESRERRCDQQRVWAVARWMSDPAACFEGRAWELRVGHDRLSADLTCAVPA